MYFLNRPINHQSHLLTGLLFWPHQRENSFTGKIPSELGSLRQVCEPVLAKSHLIGSIPPLFGNLYCLRLLSLYRNNFERIIPNELQLRNLSKQMILQLSVNNLSGMVPEQLYKISSNIFFCTQWIDWYPLTWFGLHPSQKAILYPQQIPSDLFNLI